MKQLLLLTLAVSLFLCGGCTTLEKGGAYAPVGQASDMALYTADSAYKLAYTLLDTVFLFERQNRDLLWKISPEIKHTVDKLRVEAVQYQKDWAVARAAYLANPAAANLTVLQQVLAKIQQLSVVAGTVITRYQNP